MRTIITLIVTLMSLPSWSTVLYKAQDCPVHFEGRVKEVIEPVGPSDVFSTNKVVFENLRTVKGEVNDQVVIDVLQNGPFKLESDKDYRVQLREGKLCWMEEI